MTEDKFCLKWNDFESNISSSFKELREEKDLFDVWLSCDNGQVELPAHKLILSACSAVLKHLLRRKSGSGDRGGCSSHVLYLRGVQSQDLEYILNFMYNGEVSLAQDQLNSFLSVAEDLQIKGLTQKKSSKLVNTQNSYVPKSNNLKPVKSATPTSSSTVTNYNNDMDDDIQEINPVPVIKHEHEPYSSATQSSVIGGKDNQLIGYHTEEDYLGYDDENYVENSFQEQDLAAGSKVFLEHDQIDSYLNEMTFQSMDEVGLGLKSFHCGICQKTGKAKQDIERHIESAHIRTHPYICHFCGSSHKNRRYLKVHQKIHRD